jgi:hypothetical protein
MKEITGKDDLVISFGSRKLILDPKTIKVKQFRAIYQELNTVKQAHHPLHKWPRQNVRNSETGVEELETVEDWKARVFVDYVKRCEKGEGESQEDYDIRLLNAAFEDHKYTIAFEFMNKVCDILGLKKVELEEFENASWDSIRGFCHDVLLVGEVTDPDGIFRDPRRTS